MARLGFTGSSAEIALVAATAKTVLQVAAPANQRVAVVGFGVFFDGTNPSAEPVVVELLRQTTAGTMSALTLRKKDGSLPETIQSTGQENATVEPTASDVLKRLNIHPQASYEYTAPYGQEIIIGGGGRLGIRCTAPAGVNVVAWMDCEE